MSFSSFLTRSIVLNILFLNAPAPTTKPAPTKTPSPTKPGRKSPYQPKHKPRPKAITDEE